MSLHERVETAKLDAQRAEHQLSWHAEALERNQRRDIRERVIGQGTLDAARVKTPRGS